MKHGITLLAAAATLALGGCISVTENTTTPQTAQPAGSLSAVDTKDRAPTDIRRTTIIVRDMDRSLAFWRDTLGMKMNYDTQVELSGVNLPLGEPGSKARLVLLNANDSFIGWIGLMEVVDPPLDEPAYPRRLSVGSPVIVVNTDDVPARCAAAKAVPGVTMTAEARLQTYPSRTGGPDIRVMGCNVFDPDGVAVEINQLLN